MAVILITHNIGVVAGMADDVVVMYAARAVEKAPCAELFADPRHPYTRGLLTSVPSIYEKKASLQAIPGQPPELTRSFPGCPFAPRCGEKLPRCEDRDPLEYALGEGRMANCFLHEEGAREARHRHGTAAAAAGKA